MVGGHNFGEPFEVRILLLPGGVHNAKNAFEPPSGFEPLKDLLGVMVVVSGDDLLMAAIGEPTQAGVSFFEIPRQDNNIFVETFPGAFEISPDKVILVMVVVIWIEHITPGIDASARINLTEDFDARANVIGQEC